MFETVEMAPPDPILGLEEAFKRDPNPAKINLAAGVYKDASGDTPILRTVRRAEEIIFRHETSKSYLGIAGAPEYAAAVQELVFGAGQPIVTERRAATAHAPGGTGALRVAAEFIKKINPSACVWLSRPTWPNHPNVMAAAGLAVQTYPYFDAGSNDLSFDAMLAALEIIPVGDVVVLHGSCHNPTGADPTPEQWSTIANVLADRKLLPLIDFAYQGFGEGIAQDARGILALAGRCREMLVASSFSKNFGLYNERVGALTLVAASQGAADSSLSQIKSIIRANYSNPPAHGAKIVTTILRTPELRTEWEAEVAEMRGRIHEMRQRFVRELRALGIGRDFSFIERQHGMFSFTGLTKEQVRTLRERYAIYIIDSGRINVAGMTEFNIPLLCRAIADVLQNNHRN
jgi:aspartate/tyrosine/aromatic aminotransferase